MLLDALVAACNNDDFWSNTLVFRLRIPSIMHIFKFENIFYLHLSDHDKEGYCRKTKMFSHAQIRQQGAEKQQSKINMGGGWCWVDTDDYSDSQT